MNYFCLKLRLFFAPTILLFALDTLYVLRTIQAGRMYLVTDEDRGVMWILYLFHCSGQWLSLAFHWIALKILDLALINTVSRGCRSQEIILEDGSGAQSCTWTAIRSWCIFNSAAITSLPVLCSWTPHLCGQKSLCTAHCAFNGHLKPLSGQNT